MHLLAFVHVSISNRKLFFFTKKSNSVQNLSSITLLAVYFSLLSSLLLYSGHFTLILLS